MENKGIENICAYCEYARDTHEREFVICSKKGVVNAMGKCRKFIYDPMKRIPRPAPAVDGKLEFIDLNSEN